MRSQNCDGTWTNGLTLEICTDRLFAWLNANPDAILALLVLLGVLMVVIWAMGGLDQTEEQKEEV